MTAEAAPADARAQLSSIAPGEDLSPAVLRLPLSGPARRAAVLMLFGMLDDRPSARPASAVSRDVDVLLLTRADTLRSHPGQVAFPGGRLEQSDPDPVAAALREAREETGLDPAGVEVLAALAAVPLDYSRHLVTPVLGWWRQPSPVRVVDAGESSDVFRAPVADLLNPDNRGTTVLRREGRTFRGPAFQLPSPEGPRLVWGFTAFLLDSLFDRLGWAEPWDRRRAIPWPQQR